MASATAASQQLMITGEYTTPRCRHGPPTTRRAPIPSHQPCHTAASMSTATTFVNHQVNKYIGLDTISPLAPPGAAT